MGGGEVNLIDSLSPYSTIGGGQKNVIKPVSAPYATIPGGDSLIANSFAQAVVGYNNIQSGIFMQGTPHDYPTGGSSTDNPLFVVGNGNKASARSNAFEVSYDGHTTVHDQNGNSSAGGRTPVLGGTYNDNIIYGWGDIAGGGGVNADFGVASITHTGVGTYVINLKNSNASFQFASITVTIRHNDTTNVNGVFHLKAGATLDVWCGRAEATQIGIFTGLPNAFLVHTYPIDSCSPADLPFFFKVCAR